MRIHVWLNPPPPLTNSQMLCHWLHGSARCAPKYGINRLFLPRFTKLLREKNIHFVNVRRTARDQILEVHDSETNRSLLHSFGFVSFYAMTIHS
jgi:hypothetical protein